MFIGVGGGYKEAKPFIGVGGSWKTVKEGFVGVGGLWKSFFINFRVSISPTSITRFSGGNTVTTSSTTVTVEGPDNVSYAWIGTPATGGPFYEITITEPSSATTAFVGRSIPARGGDPAVDNTAEFTCRVTNDDTGEFLDTERVFVRFQA